MVRVKVFECDECGKMKVLGVIFESDMDDGCELCADCIKKAYELVKEEGCAKTT